MPEDNPREDYNRHSRDLGSIKKPSTKDIGLQTVLVRLRNYFLLWSTSEKMLMLVKRGLYEQ